VTRPLVTATTRVEVAPGVDLSVLIHRPAAGAGGCGGCGGGATDGDGRAGRPVLAVHGLASNARLWDGVASALVADGHPVAAVDQRGHGLSDKPANGYDFATLTSDLVAVADHLGWVGARRPVVAGQSWGANVAVELAARHPDRVAALVLVDGGTIELSGRFADWPTCEAALTPPPLDGTPLTRMRRWLDGAHPDWPAAGIDATLANMEVLADGTVRPCGSTTRRSGGRHWTCRCWWWPPPTPPPPTVASTQPSEPRWTGRYASCRTGGPPGSPVTTTCTPSIPTTSPP